MKVLVVYYRHYVEIVDNPAKKLEVLGALKYILVASNPGADVIDGAGKLKMVTPVADATHINPVLIARELIVNAKYYNSGS